MNNIQFKSTASNMEVMLEAFFCVQPNEHVKAWNWHCYMNGQYRYEGRAIVYGRKVG